MCSKIESIHKTSAWELTKSTPRKDPITSKWTWVEKLKTRLVAWFEQQKRFALWWNLRACCQVTHNFVQLLQLHLKINGAFEHLDITFINGDLEEEIINGPTFKICDSKEGPLHVLTSKGTLWTKTSITCLVLET